MFFFFQLLKSWLMPTQASVVDPDPNTLQLDPYILEAMTSHPLNGYFMESW